MIANGSAPEGVREIDTDLEVHPMPEPIDVCRQKAMAAAFRLVGNYGDLLERWPADVKEAAAAHIRQRVAQFAEPGQPAPTIGEVISLGSVAERLGLR